jgi:hypothetical protein
MPPTPQFFALPHYANINSSRTCFGFFALLAFILPFYVQVFLNLSFFFQIFPLFLFIVHFFAQLMYEVGILTTRTT